MKVFSSNDANLEFMIQVEKKVVTPAPTPVPTSEATLAPGGGSGSGSSAGKQGATVIK